MKYQGNCISEGIAIGRAYTYSPVEIHITEHTIARSEVALTLEEFQDLKRTAMQELLQLQRKLQATDPGKAKIFAAHKEMLEDEELEECICDAIEECYTLDWAIESSFTQFIDLLSKAKDPLISARTADLLDVKKDCYGYGPVLLRRILPSCRRMRLSYPMICCRLTRLQSTVNM